MINIFVFVLMSVCLTKSNLIVGGVYTFPHSSLLIYESYIFSVKYLINKYLNDTFIICGDNNIPEISWANDNNCIPLPLLLLPHAFLNPVQPTVSSKKKYVSNSNYSILDLVFCNDNNLTNEELLGLLS